MPIPSNCVDSTAVCRNVPQKVQVDQNCYACVAINLVDPRTGDPFDLTQYDIHGEDYVPPSSSSSSSSSSSVPGVCNYPGSTAGSPPITAVLVCIKELESSANYEFIKACRVLTEVDAVAGIVHLEVDAVMSQTPGVWAANAIIVQNGLQRRVVKFWFEVEPNLSVYNATGALTMPEIRLLIRDVCPEFNDLEGILEFQDQEIMMMIRRPIDMWNEMPPPVAYFTPESFPFRYNWSQAVIGELLRMMVYWLRRNKLDYQAAGLSVDLEGRVTHYERLSDKLLAEWRDFVRNKKISINQQLGWGRLGGWRTPPYR